MYIDTCGTSFILYCIQIPGDLNREFAERYVKTVYKRKLSPDEYDYDITITKIDNIEELDTHDSKIPLVVTELEESIPEERKEYIEPFYYNNIRL